MRKPNRTTQKSRRLARTAASLYDGCRYHGCCAVQPRRDGSSSSIHPAASTAPDKRKPSMAKNHYVTKPKRRNKNSNRKDPSAATMAKLRQHAAAETAKPGK
jgi:hypothetical protein